MLLSLGLFWLTQPLDAPPLRLLEPPSMQRRCSKIVAAHGALFKDDPAESWFTHDICSFEYWLLVVYA